MGNQRKPFRIQDYIGDQPHTWAQAEERAYETNTNGGYDKVDPLMLRDTQAARYDGVGDGSGPLSRGKFPEPFLDVPASFGQETPVHGRRPGSIRRIPRDPSLEYEGEPDNTGRNYEASQSDPWDASNEPDAFSPAEMIQPGAEEVESVDGPALDAWLAAKAAQGELGAKPSSNALRAPYNEEEVFNTGNFVADENDFHHADDYVDMDALMVPDTQKYDGKGTRTTMTDDPNANEYLANDALELATRMRGEKIDPEAFWSDQAFGDGDKRGMTPSRSPYPRQRLRGM